MPKDETTLRMPVFLRDRLKIVAAIEKCTMREWIERRVEDAERSGKKRH
jgi:hypothetical protein